jgi:hypothetical protein
MKLFFTFWFIILSQLVFCQPNEITIKFIPIFENLQLEIDKKYQFQGKNLEIGTLKFYVSNIKLHQNSEQIAVFNKKYHLIDLEKPETLQIAEDNIPAFNKIEFDIGIDSTTNVYGAFGGDLDPTNGMYWAWQSGYINFKLEGKSKLCPARKNQFSYHIGGYQFPYNSLQKISLSVKNNTEIIIEMDIAGLLKKIDLTKTFEVMSPNPKSMEIAKNIALIFKIAQ